MLHIAGAGRGELASTSSCTGLSASGYRRRPALSGCLVISWSSRLSRASHPRADQSRQHSVSAHQARVASPASCLYDQLVSQSNSLISLASTAIGSSLGSVWEAGGEIWSGVLPSMCRWPSGITMTRTNSILFSPPLDSEACSVVGRLGAFFIFRLVRTGSRDHGSPYPNGYLLGACR
jgi:hypothetical protein